MQQNVIWSHIAGSISWTWRGYD